MLQIQCEIKQQDLKRVDHHFVKSVSISSPTGECAAENFKNFCSSSLWTCLHHMVILRSQNKITDFLMVLAWASPFRYHLLNMLKKNVTSISNIWKQMTSILSNLNNFHSLEVVDRVSETQLQVGENSNWIIWRLKGLGVAWGSLTHMK